MSATTAELSFAEMLDGTDWGHDFLFSDVML